MVVLYIVAFVVISFVVSLLFVMSFTSENAVIGMGKDFDEKWPVISDEEFVRLCSSEVDLEVARKVRDILSNMLGVERARIHPQQNLMDDLGAY